jgi:hypothetical protein
MLGCALSVWSVVEIFGEKSLKIPDSKPKAKKGESCAMVRVEVVLRLMDASSVQHVAVNV